MSDEDVDVGSTEIQVKERQSAMTLQVLLQQSAGLQQLQRGHEIQMNPQLAHFCTHVFDEVRGMTDTLLFEKIGELNQVVLNDSQLL